MNLPPAGRISDEQFVANLRVVLDGVCDALALDPDKLTLVREGVLGLLIDAQGVLLFRRAYLVDIAAEDLVEGLEGLLATQNEEE